MSDLGNFKGMKRNGEETWQNHLYVTYGTKCQCNCECYRNQVFDEAMMKTHKRKLKTKIMEEADNFRHIVFGGGEPLLEIDEILELVRKINERQFCSTFEDREIKFSITTNGERRIFLGQINDVCHNCKRFSQFILSRYHFDDEINENIFKSRGQLLTSDDLENLCDVLKEKIQLSCLCQKGGIETILDVIAYIQWAAEIGITNIMFSDFQDEVTTPSAKHLGCDKNLLKAVQEVLEEDMGLKRESTIVFSAGYKITTFKTEMVEVINPPIEIMLLSILNGEPIPVIKEQREITVSFREFISKEELEAEWKIATKHTYNYSIMPNGTMYKGWSCEELV